MLRKVNQQVVAPELLLAEALRGPRAHPDQRTPGSAWLPVFALNATALDTASWQTRAARGLSWHRSGKLPQRRLAH